MALLTDDQKMLQETAASFLADEGSIAKQLRHWRGIDCKDGFGHGLWKQFAELGLNGICIPESHGGLGLGAVEQVHAYYVPLFRATPDPTFFDEMPRLRTFVEKKYPAAATLAAKDLSDSSFVDELARTGYIARLYPAQK